MKKFLFLFLLAATTGIYAMQKQPSDFQKTEEFLKILTDGSFADLKSILEKTNANATKAFDFGRLPGANRDFQDRTPLDILLKSPESLRDRNQKIELLLSKGANKAELNHDALNAILSTNAQELRWYIAHGAQVNPEIENAIGSLERGPARYKNIAAQMKKVIAEQKEMATALPSIAPAEQHEQDLVWGIKLGNLEAVKAAVSAGASVKEPIKYVFRFVGQLPLEIAYEEKQYPIVEYLLQNGARDPKVLNYYLRMAAARDMNVEQVTWLLKNGAKDENNSIYEQLVDDYDDERDPVKKSKIEQVFKMLKSASIKGPLRLAPLVKPVAAHVVQPTPQPLEKPVEAVAAKPKVILKPTTKPIATPK